MRARAAQGTNTTTPDKVQRTPSLNPLKTKEDMKEFEEAIEAYLTERAKTNERLAERMQLADKTIGKCCRYIVGEAAKRKRGGVGVLSHEEAYGLAMHYYDEDEVEINTNYSLSGVGSSSASVAITDTKPLEKEIERLRGEVTKLQDKQAKAAQAAQAKAEQAKAKAQAERERKQRQKAETEQMQMSLF